MSEKRIDDVTGTETTGHNWDGIEELNNPLPRWWLWTFYATVLFAVIYTIFFPAWPLVSGATQGVLGWSTRGEVARDIAQIDEGQQQYREGLLSVDVHMIRDNEELQNYAVQAGAALFRNNCSQCHGSGAAGAIGYPNLLDDDWLWGGRIEDIAHTIRHGIRNEEDPDARFSQMPAFGEMLTEGEIAGLARHVQSLPDGADPLSGPAGQLFADNCATCHGDDAQGDPEIGAPDLTDAIWLYGSDLASLEDTISRGPYGVMPPWGERLGEANVRALAAYVHQLGGGEAGEPRSETNVEEQIGEGDVPEGAGRTGGDPSDPDEVPFPEEASGTD
ncbi:cytochrome-c oxidase, cbb3-type subunit III [Tropicimonas sp. IMCC34011]|uniref:cytochrome-c oxidase, cbb3-type subunit III n=1 Tax=Tropicimonas sp. IMCC34011 TaxID=2248759 RepID=UPI000E238973